MSRVVVPEDEVSLWDLMMSLPQQDPVEQAQLDTLRAERAAWAGRLLVLWSCGFQSRAHDLRSLQDEWSERASRVPNTGRRRDVAVVRAAIAEAAADWYGRSTFGRRQPSAWASIVKEHQHAAWRPRWEKQLARWLKSNRPLLDELVRLLREEQPLHAIRLLVEPQIKGRGGLNRTVLEVTVGKELAAAMREETTVCPHCGDLPCAVHCRVFDGMHQPATSGGGQIVCRRCSAPADPGSTVALATWSAGVGDPVRWAQSEHGTQSGVTVREAPQGACDHD